MSVEEALEVLERAEKKLIILHHNADLDCVASAVGLYLSFDRFKLFAPLGISSPGRKILKRFKVPWSEDESLDEYDLLVILDANSLEQVGNFDWERYKRKTLIIDHHDYNPKYEEALLYLWKRETSCSEIIFQIIEVSGKEISEEVAEALLIGVIGDTARFKFAKNSTLRNVCRMLPHLGRDFSEILEEVEAGERSVNLDRSKRIAVLKAMQRSSYLDFEGVLIWKSFISSFEGDVAGLIVSLVADVAIVGAQRGEEARISVRARKWLVDRGLNLAEICRKVGEEFSGGGGGHSAAAGINAVGDVEAIANAVVEEVKEKLREIL